MKKFPHKVMLAAAILLCAFPVYAQEISAADVQLNLDILWTCVAAFLVFFMQAGFAMVETGYTRARNAVNILIKNLIFQ